LYCINICFLWKDSTENKDHLVFVTMKVLISLLLSCFLKVQSNIWACNHIFNGLLQLDENLNIQPDIAKSWTISPDAKPILYVAKGHLFSNTFYLVKTVPEQ
jgi:peptide/nickel transport system substrate-binding protein